MGKLLMVFGFVGLVVVGTIFTGFALQLSWGWLAVPLWGMPEIRIIEGIAASFLIKLPFLSSFARIEGFIDRDKKTEGKVIGAVVYSVLMPTFMILFAWVYSLFI
jgi:hypothetical protein